VASTKIFTSAIKNQLVLILTIYQITTSLLNKCVQTCGDFAVFFLINVMKLVFNDDVAQQCELLTTVFEMSAMFQENYIFFQRIRCLGTLLLYYSILYSITLFFRINRTAPHTVLPSLPALPERNGSMSSHLIFHVFIKS